MVLYKLIVHTVFVTSSMELLFNSKVKVFGFFTVVILLLIPSI